MASTSPLSEKEGASSDGDGDRIDRETEDVDARALTQRRIQQQHQPTNAAVPSTPSSVGDSDTKESSPRGLEFLEDDDDDDSDEMPHLTEITLEEGMGLDMEYSEVSITLEEIEFSRLKTLEKSTALAEAVKAATSQKSRDKIKARPPRPTREGSSHKPSAKDKVSSDNQQEISKDDDNSYHGAMNTLVEQMHGSGRSLNVDDCLKITRHSQRRYNTAVRRSLSRHDREGDDSSVSSRSSFAVESFHGDWTGWSSSESGTGSSDIFIVSPRDTRSGHKKMLRTKDEEPDPPSRPPISPVAGRKTKDKIKSKTRRERDSIFGSTHSAPSKGSQRMLPSAEFMERMHSSDPGQLDYRTTRKRSIKRFQKLLDSYEAPSGSNATTYAKKDDSHPRPKDNKLSTALASLPSPPQRTMPRVTSEDSTVQHINGLPEVDPDVSVHDRTELHSNRTVDQVLSSTAQAKPRRASTSSYGYYSPWRDMNARKLRASMTAADKKTPKTQPLSGSPTVKSKIQSPMLSRISPPPLSSPRHVKDLKNVREQDT